MGFIYIIKCKINNKVYIGQTNKTIEKRWDEHKKLSQYYLQFKNNKEKIETKCFKNIKYSYLYKSMAKHGIDNFYIDILEEIESKNNNKLLDQKEIEYIEKYKSTNSKNGYNLQSGGSANCKQSEKTKKIISQTKCENVDKQRNEKLQGLPAHTSYRNHKTRGEQILINIVDKNFSKTFNIKDYNSLEETKKVVIEYMKKIENEGVQKNKKDPSLPKGLQKIKEGYRVNIVHKGKNYDKKFINKKNTQEENKKNAFEYYNKLKLDLNSK